MIESASTPSVREQVVTQISTAFEQGLEAPSGISIYAATARQIQELCATGFILGHPSDLFFTVDPYSDEASKDEACFNATRRATALSIIDTLVPSDILDPFYMRALLDYFLDRGIDVPRGLRYRVLENKLAQHNIDITSALPSLIAGEQQGALIVLPKSFLRPIRVAKDRQTHVLTLKPNPNRPYRLTPFDIVGIEPLDDKTFDILDDIQV